MPTPPTNNTSKPTNEEEHGFADTNAALQLDPWIVAHLQICKRDEQPITIEEATDGEFDAWVQAHAIVVKENGISGWSFDDRCRLVNYALAHGYTLTFVDGTRMPQHTPEDEVEDAEVSPAASLPEEASEEADALTEKEG